jgi:hypothetical protein
MSMIVAAKLTACPEVLQHYSSTKVYHHIMMLRHKDVKQLCARMLTNVVSVSADSLWQLLELFA